VSGLRIARAEEVNALKLIQIQDGGSTQVTDADGRYIATFPSRAEARAFTEGYAHAQARSDDPRLRRAIVAARRVLAEVDGA
jgi:hypothetical protein